MGSRGFKHRRAQQKLLVHPGDCFTFLLARLIEKAE